MSVARSPSDPGLHPTVDGYTVERCLHRSTRRQVYSAESPVHGPVVVTLHSGPTASERDLAATRHAFAMGRRLDGVDGVVPHLDLVPTGRDLALVTGSVVGSRLLRDDCDGHLGVPEICDLGASIADVLGRVHRAGLVHGGLSPDSVLIDPQGGAHLFDLELATDVESEHAPVFDPDRLGPSLAYVSPEQTGRVNRTVDGRSDLYSLAVILFELLTGAPPFTEASPRALVHAHIARRAPSLDERRPGSPALLGALLERLMHKDPERRYAVADAVAGDLRAMARDLREGVTPDFALGNRDLEPRLRMSDKLFGRDVELAALLDAFASAARGERSVVFVAGYSGVGKSRLVSELHAPVAAVDGWFATGKFDLYRRDLPYAAFVQAAGELVSQVLTLPAASLAEVRTSLGERLRGAAGALVELVPELELLIGAQEPPSEVTPLDAQRRLEAGILTLVDVVASAEHPLVLFIDDLQWSDLASLRLLDMLLDTSSTSTALMLIAAWRDNEVGPGHPAWGFVERHRLRARTLVLEPLELDDVTDWIAGSLNCERSQVGELAGLTMDRTLGNPFFVRQFFRELVADGLLRIDGTASWSWDARAIEGRGVSENVGDLVSRQLERLDPEVRQILQAASCIGTEFDLESVATVVDGDRDAVVAGLRRAMLAGLIVPRDDAYLYASSEAVGINPCFAFLHDRVQETARESMDPAVRAVAHVAVARHHIATAAAGEVQGARLDELAVDVASHFTAGAEAISGEAEGLEAATWMVRGAVRAKAVMATDAAQAFLDRADALLGEDRWTVVPDLARRLHTEAADVAYIDGRFADIDRHADAVLRHSSDPLQRLAIHHIYIGIGVAQNQWGDATEYALWVMAEEYGIELPLRPSLPAVAAEIAKVQWMLRGYSIEDLRNLPPMTDELVDASMSLLMKTATNAYWASPNLVPLIGLTMVRQSVRHGNCGLSAYGYALYGLVLSAVLFDSKGGHRYGELAMDMIGRFDARHLHGKTALVHHGFIRHGVDPMADCGRDVLEAYHEAHAAGDIENAAYCAMAGLYTAIVAGEPLPALAERLAPYVAAVNGSGHAQTIYGTSVWVQAVENLRADRVDPELSGAHIDFEPRLEQLLADEDGNAIPQGVCAAGFLAFMLGDEARAERHLGLLFSTMRSTPGQVYLMPCLAMYAVLLIRKRAAGEGTSADRARVTAITTLLSRRAKANPGDHRPFLDFIDAERAAAARRPDAGSRFLDAASAAAASGIAYLEGLALERAAAMHEARGHVETARHLMDRAVVVWHRYGATARLRLLGVEPEHETVATASSIDVDTLIETAAAVSRELEVDAVVARVLQLALENAGARRAMLALRHDGRLMARACAEVSDERAVEVAPLDAPVDSTLAGWPVRVIDYVARTGSDLVLSDATVDSRFERDPYVRGHQALSVLCAPLHRGGELVGVLYMENSLSHDVFTARSVNITRTIAGQAAIAIENAGLYDRQREMATAFSRFVPRPFLERLGRDGVEQVQLGDAVVSEVTVLFSDLREFTSVSETLSAAENFELLNAYLAEMDTPIHENGGFIDKFIGDAVMALFTNGADGAVAAAVGMTEALARFNRNPRRGTELRMGIGLHAGPVMLGTIGSAQRMDTTVIGDTVNTASRMEGLTKPYGAAVLVSDAVLDRLREPGRFTFREVGRVRVKGKNVPVTVHEVLDARGEDIPSLLAGRSAFEAGLAAWYQGDFDSACGHFRDAVQAAPGDALAIRYLLQAIELVDEPPPPGWDGIDSRVEK